MNPANADSLLKQLADIRGLGDIDWWPLAPGWWALLALALIAVASAVAVALRCRAWRRSWKSEADRMLTDMGAKLGDDNARAVAADFSIAMRRIAMQRISRAACAGLEGARWLEWLTANDPRSFNWTKAGALLTEAPYAPSGTLSAAALRPLILAARNWVR